jgi:prevent-host-death family protein
MRKISATAARTNLLRLLDEVERGESFLITRYGKPIAWLSPYTEPNDTESLRSQDKGREH